jgi:hypothetical protein
MEQLGFGQRWRDILALIWSSTSSRIILNLEHGHPIKLGWGLRQGDPLSPMIFILAMDPLQSLLDIATQTGLLHPIGANPIILRTSLYADDAALFFRHLPADVENLQQLLQHFGSATSLCTNIHKLEIIPIRCEAMDVPAILGQFQAKICDLPCKYLGLPLRIGRIKWEDEQLLVDKVVAKLSRWKGRLTNKAGRLALVNSVLTTIVIYHMSVFTLSKWVIKRIDRIRQNFL